ncbi:3'-flap repair endonuclease Xpf [uncultured archaeon]|nr:3'-flap repair endonuclease Xpf [uncultured archaeon]
MDETPKTLQHPLIRNAAPQMRRYQEAAVVKALDEDTLVVLPTGLGKTLIAAMVAADRLYKYPDGKILVLAPTRPLVVQHEKALSEILTETNSAVLTGKIPPKQRHEIYEKARLIYATPQTIEKDIARGLNLSDVVLLVFDEVHRASGDYPYEAIAEHYRKHAKNPRILGLTASPGGNAEKVKELVSAIGFKVIEARDEQDRDVQPYVQDVNIEWIQVRLPPQMLEIKALLEETLRTPVRRLKELGYLQTADLTRLTKKDLLTTQIKAVTTKDATGINYEAASLAAEAIKVNHAIELLETQGISSLDKYISRLTAKPSKAVKRLLSSPTMAKATHLTSQLRQQGIDHPKLEKLAEITAQYAGRKVLIFTQYRDSIPAIIDRLNEKDILAHEFIGQQAKGDRAGMTQKKQLETLEKFRNGAFTALVATSVAEEGLDIPRVDAVIFYEPVPSEIRSIQRRGRTGRTTAGNVVILMTKGTRDEAYFWSARNKEKKMKEVISTMNEETTQEESPQKTLTEFDDKKTEPTENTPTFNTLPQGETVHIYVDGRERGSKLISLLRENAAIDVCNLPVGDFLLSDRVAVERKTVADFLQSIIDQRLLAQASELTRNFQAPILILEGTDDLYAQRAIHPNAIRGALAALAIDLKISVIPSQNEEDTAALLLAIARREQWESNRETPLRGERKPMLLSERQRFMVESLPNVSSVLARRLLSQYKSVRNLAAADTKSLMKIEGIGAKKADDIHRVLTSEYDEETAI